jgi:hypothetical protein
MGVGHAALALGAAKATPRLNVGWLVFAAFLADFLLGIFAWMGLESAHVPENYAAKHYLTFTFPYSYGLAPLILWGVIFGLLVSRTTRSNRTIVFAVVAAVVVSHFLLDGLVHVPLASFAAAFVVLEVFDLFKSFLGRFLGFVRAAEILSLLGNYFVSTDHFFYHRSPRELWIPKTLASGHDRILSLVRIATEYRDLMSFMRYRPQTDWRVF